MSQAGANSTSGGGGGGDLSTLTPDVGGVVTAVANNIDIHGINGIVTSNTGPGSLTISGGVGLLQNISVTLTSPEIKNLATVSKLIVPAQGANTLIVPYVITYNLVYGGTSVFTDVNALNLYYFDGASFFQITSQGVSGVVDNAFTTYFPVLSTSNNAYTVAQSINLPVVLFNPGAQITGNAADDNQLIIQLQYVVLTV